MWGIEGDVDGTNIRSNHNVALAPVGAFPGGSGFVNVKQDWLASIRGRIGYTWGPGMIYLTGGGAWAGVEARGGATLLTGPSGTFTSSLTKSGYVVGVGCQQ